MTVKDKATSVPDQTELNADVADIRQSLSPYLSYSDATAIVRRLKKLRKAGFKSGVRTKLSILSNTTSSQLASLIDAYLFAYNIDVEIEEAPYGLLRQQVLDPSSELYSAAPDFVFLASSYRDLLKTPLAGDDKETVDAALDETVSEWESFWTLLHDGLGCQIIQNNFDAPPWRAYGNLEPRFAGALGNYISRVNQALCERAPAWVSVYDLDGLAANVGRWNWSDQRFFNLAKMPCGPEYMPRYAHGIAAQIAARLGRSHKCLVLDLDNTLWGGVVGDDGLAGINIGQGDAEGEAFVAFQSYAKSLAERGIILAVCSKNEDANAREPFEKRSEMVLKLDDISSFVANWEDKAGNLRRIAKELNIGLDSLVFVDDNPAERALVRQLAPEVAVPEMPVDPADYVRVLAEHCYFEPVSINSEDFKRTEYYRANAKRDQLASSAGDIDGFLKSLDMRAWVGPIGELEQERSVQLIGKSNQFNLTTIRHAAGDVDNMRADPNWFTCVIKLADRFGDNGLITVLLAKEDGDALDIDTWLMSCRVLKRGVENLMLNSVAEEAQKRGLKRVTGTYIPTAKNVLVKDHYASLGFEPVSEAENGTTHWSLTVDADWTPLNHHIIKEDT